MGFRVGDIVEDMIITGETKVPAELRGRTCLSKRIVCTCRVCGREKLFQESTLNRVVGTSHRMCNHEETEKIRKNYPEFYRCWNHIKARINNPNLEHYERYGGRGLDNDYEYFVDFCDELFQSYLEHVKQYGLANTTVERIDNDLGYIKGNIKWATWKEQAVNRCTTIEWECINTMTNTIVHTNNLKQFAREYGLNYTSVTSAVRRGQREYKNWSFKKV